MEVNDMIVKTVDSGISPLTLKYDVVNYFDSKRIIMRSSFQIESLDLGVLSFEQYRFVASRCKKGEELIKRLVDKLFSDYSNLMSLNPSIDCITIPVFTKMLLDGEFVDYLFKAFINHKDVLPSTIGVEVPAEILFEDISIVKKRLDDLKKLGVKVAMFEIGNEYCPILRLSDLAFDYAFTDIYIKECLTNDNNYNVAVGLVNYLHMYNIKVFALALDNEMLQEKASNIDFDGYSKDIPYTGNDNFIRRDE